jgi:hypothetical protein
MFLFGTSLFSCKAVCQHLRSSRRYTSIYLQVSQSAVMASKLSAGKRKNPNSPPSPQRFQFINFTDAPHVDEYDRDVIRSQAISDYHQRKRNNNPRTSDANTGQVAKGSTSTFRLRPHPQDGETQRHSRAAQHTHPQGSTFADQGIFQTSPVSDRNIAQPGSSDGRFLDDGSRLPLATVSAGTEQRESNNDQALLAKLPPRSKQGIAEELVNKLDLLAINLDPLLNLPVTASDRIRLWIHHYCKHSSSILFRASKRKRDV